MPRSPSKVSAALQSASLLVSLVGAGAGAVVGPLVGCGGAETETGTSPPAEPTTVFVDEGAAPGGDGTAEHPLRTVREALELPWRIEAIALAAGHYPAPTSWEFGSSLTIFGYTGEPTTLAAEDDATVLSWSGDGGVVLRELELGSPLAREGGETGLYALTASELPAPALSLTDTAASIFGLELGTIVQEGGEGAVGDGVVAAGGSLRWSGGSALGVPDRALVLLGAEAEIDSLTLSSVSRAALTVQDGASVVARDVVIEPGSIGVFVQAASLRLEHATITGAATAALLGGVASSTEVVASTFTDCPQGHVAAQGEGAAITLESSTLRGASMNSCFFASMTEGAIVVRGNTIETCAGSGVSLYGVSDVTVDGNDISDILPDPIFGELAEGISVLASQGSLTGNRIYDTDSYGISANQSVVTIDGNDLGPTAAAGISLVDPGEAPCVVSHNVVHEATGAGVLMLAAWATLTDNEVTGTRFEPADGFGDGIAFGQGAHATVQGNTLLDNARNGIVFLDGVTGEISGNTASGNAGWGILEFCTGEPSSVVVGDNTLDGNTLGTQSLCQ